MKIKKDMMVKVVSGNFKGMTGKVLKVITNSQRAIEAWENYNKG